MEVEMVIKNVINVEGVGHGNGNGNGDESGNGSANGNFTAGAITGLPDFPSSVLVADFNNDGISDIASTIDQAFSANSILITLFASNGTPSSSYSLPITFRPARSIAEDFNSDGNIRQPYRILFWKMGWKRIIQSERYLAV